MRAHSAHFSISYGPSPTLSGGAVVVPKKVVKKSVARHALKRRMREIIRPYISDTQALIAYAKPGSSELSYQDMQNELSGLIEGILPKL